MEVEKKLFTVDETAEMLGVTRWAIRKWISENKIPYTKIGRCIRFTMDDINSKQIRVPAQEAN